MHGVNFRAQHKQFPDIAEIVKVCDALLTRSVLFFLHHWALTIATDKHFSFINNQHIMLLMTVDCTCKQSLIPSTVFPFLSAVKLIRREMQLVMLPLFLPDYMLILMLISCRTLISIMLLYS